MLADVERTHPHLLSAGGSHEANVRYVDPTAFLRSRPPPVLDPLEAEAPAVELVDPVPALTRRTVRDLATSTRLGGDDVDRLVLATSEAVTNATVHGRPPVITRVWAAPERMLVAVSDRGEGPADPYVGLTPRSSAVNGGGGFGLWIVNQLVATTYDRSADGFTIRLVAGAAVT